MACDAAPPALHTLLEIRKYCPKVLGKTEVWVDGGVQRGTGIVKALALGARVVGLGRAPLYGLSVSGAARVSRVITSTGPFQQKMGIQRLIPFFFPVLRKETETALRLLCVK